MAIGSFFGLLQTGVGVGVAAGESLAAVLEAIAAAWLIRRFIPHEDPFSRARDVLRFCLLAGCGATAVSATVGVASLALGGLGQTESFAYLWGTWWLGDMMGALIVAPFLVVWSNRGIGTLRPQAWIKIGLVFAALVLAAGIAFWGPFVSSAGVSDYPIAFLTLPMVVAAAFLAGQRGATAACVVCSVMAISGTASGLGPFFRGSVNESLLLLQSYLVVVSMTAMILAAVLKERNWALHELRLSYENLDHRITERTRELSSANTQLKHAITELNQTQEALKQSERRHRTIVEECFDGVFVQKGSTIVFANPRLHNMLGYRQGELEGLEHWRIYHPDYQELTRNRAKARMEGRSVQTQYEVSLLMRDRTSFPGEISAKVILFDKEPGIQVWVRDLTKQKLLEKQLVQAQKHEALGTLTGGIAHDFNNLLTVINGYSEFLLLHMEKYNPMREDVQKILKTGRQGAGLVQRLMAFGRKADMSPHPVDLSIVVEDAVAIIRETFPRLIEIETKYDPALKMVNADSSQIEQVLMNLCINAKEAMPKEGTVTITAENKLVDQECSSLYHNAAPGPHVLISVSDTGPGMNEKTLDRIFDPFFTTKGLDFNKGAGLGLSVARGIVEQHGGWIMCDSEPGKGTTFKMHFPAIDSPPETEQAEVSVALISGDSLILVVDDEDLVRELGRRILEEAGHKVITASNGKEAVEIYKRERSLIGLVILDLVMPQMEGEACLQELLKINPDVKVLFSTGRRLSQEERSRLAAHAKGFVSKPYQVRQLLKDVRAALETS